MATATYIARVPAPAESVYVRRRIGVAAFVVALAVSIGVAVDDGLADRGGDPASTAAVGHANTYLVQPGDTLWAIAQRMHPGGDTAGYVDALVSLNGGSVIVPGQQLRLP